MFVAGADLAYIVIFVDQAPGCKQKIIHQGTWCRYAHHDLLPGWMIEGVKLLSVYFSLMYRCMRVSLLLGVIVP